MEILIYSIPLFSSLIGWVTNYLAIKMLFFPREEKSFLFIKFQGVIPKRIGKLAEKMANLVANQLVDKKMIKDKLISNIDINSVKPIIESKIEVVIKEKIKGLNPMISMFINDDLINKFKSMMMEEIDVLLPEIIQKLSNSAIDKFNLKEEVKNKVLGFSTIEIEKIMWNILKTEFKFIELLGAVLGFIIGLLQLVFISI